MIADAIVLLLTWRKTFGMRTRASRLSVNTPFLTLIIRDGEFVRPSTVLRPVSIHAQCLRILPFRHYILHVSPNGSSLVTSVYVDLNGF